MHFKSFVSNLKLNIIKNWIVKLNLCIVKTFLFQIISHPIELYISQHHYTEQIYSISKLNIRIKAIKLACIHIPKYSLPKETSTNVLYTPQFTCKNLFSEPLKLTSNLKLHFHNFQTSSFSFSKISISPTKTLFSPFPPILIHSILSPQILQYPPAFRIPQGSQYTQPRAISISPWPVSPGGIADCLIERDIDKTRDNRGTGEFIIYGWGVYRGKE